MKSLKLTIEFSSPVGSLLQSDTILGQFAWWYRYKYGEDKLKEVLADFESNPFIVFSDGFLENTVAMPILKPKNPKSIKEKWGDNYYIEMKNIKKASFVKLGDWVKKEKLNIFDLRDFIYKKDDKNKPAIVSAVFLKNSVNRIKNTTDSGLYSSKEYFYSSKIDIYAKYDDKRIETAIIKEIFESIGEFGFGRDKSTGKGRFRVVDLKENPEILNKRDTKTFISLSSFVPDDKCEVLFGKTFTKFGKHGGNLVFGNPFKKPVILFKSGSVFKIKEKSDIYGKGLNLSNYEGHYHNAYTIPLFIDVEE